MMNEMYPNLWCQVKIKIITKSIKKDMLSLLYLAKLQPSVIYICGKGVMKKKVPRGTIGYRDGVGSAWTWLTKDGVVHNTIDRTTQYLLWPEGGFQKRAAELHRNLSYDGPLIPGYDYILDDNDGEYLYKDKATGKYIIAVVGDHKKMRIRVYNITCLTREFDEYYKMVINDEIVGMRREGGIVGMRRDEDGAAEEVILTIEFSHWRPILEALHAGEGEDSRFGLLIDSGYQLRVNGDTRGNKDYSVLEEDVRSMGGLKEVSDNNYEVYILKTSGELVQLVITTNVDGNVEGTPARKSHGYVHGSKAKFQDNILFVHPGKINANVEI